MKTTIRLALAIFLLAPSLSRPTGYDLPNMGSRDLALAGSAVADQVDAAAAIANPSALARQPGFGLSFSAGYLDLETTWTATTGDLAPYSPETTDYHPTPPPVLAVSYGFELAGRRAGVGLGFNVIGGGNMYWADDWAGRGRIITVDRKLYGVYLTAGYEVLPQLRVGGGLVYVHSTEYLKQGIEPYADAYGELDTSGGGVGFDLSAEWRPLPSLSFGADFKFQVDLSLEGDGHFQVPDALKPSLPDQGARHDLTYPSILHMGVAWRPVAPVQVLFDYTFADYSVYVEDRFVGDAGFLAVVPRDYDDGHTFRLGTEWDATARLVVRAGVLRDLSGVKTDNYSPTLPDSDSWVLSGGLGWRFSPALTANAAVYHAWRDEIASTGADAFPGSYRTTALLASVGLSWRPGAGRTE
ncbi:MAG TPA: outer membrane protein transport protein [Anaeromyxobacteraceae bacterium]|nr:outer membrane protein transport protein [Anaeromyxobacteraceae bacterium]